MRQDRLYTLIGIFVVGAFCILIYGGIFFYNVYLKEQIETYVMFFSGSLEGLESKSPVAYRGVKIGEVTKIELVEDKVSRTVKIPVYVQFFVERTIGFKQDPISLLIEKGYVADIAKPNLITGVAGIDLIQTKKPVPLVKTTFNGYPIFPTEHIAEHYSSLDETLKAAKQTFEDISKFVKAKNTTETIESLREMANSFNEVATSLDKQISPVSQYFIQSLEHVSKAANSTENFMDYLSRYPESLLRGKQ